MLWDFVDTKLDVPLELVEVTTDEGVLANKHLEQDGAERPHVCLLVVQRPLEHLRGHVEWSATHRLMQLGLSVDCLCQAEVP